MKYTVKELIQIEGMHDVMHCKQPQCKTCNAYWSYAKRLREQANQNDPLQAKPPAIKRHIREQYQAGKSIREIAFNVDWDDDAVIEYLRGRKLYKEPKRRQRRAKRSPVQLRLQLGMTKSAQRMQREEHTMSQLIDAGYSKQVIARRMCKTVQAIGQYIDTHSLPKIDQTTMQIYDVTFGVNQHRYFDRDGNEYQVKRMENEQ